MGFRLQGSPCRRQDFLECLIGPATPDFLVASAIRQAMKFRYAVAGMALALALAALSWRATRTYFGERTAAGRALALRLRREMLSKLGKLLTYETDPKGGEASPLSWKC
jgi:hypothetical protein